jgi:transcriptional regulator with XRE-family HTH domain
MDDWRDRLQEVMMRRGLNAKQLSLRAGRGETYVRDILAGKSPSVDHLSQIADECGVSLSWLLDGDRDFRQDVTIIGTLTSEEKWEPYDHSPGKIEMAIEGGEPIALEVLDDTMFPAYRSGDLLIGARSPGSSADNLIGLDCIVLSDDGSRLVRRLNRGRKRGLFDLKSYNPAHDDLRDAKLAWVALIRWIRRSQG